MLRYKNLLIFIQTVDTKQALNIYIIVIIANLCPIINGQVGFIDIICSVTGLIDRVNQMVMVDK